MANDLTALDAGIDRAAAPDEAQAREYAAQEKDVQGWLRKVEAARKFDAPARQQYARDRCYARGDSGFEVDENIIGTNIDILEAHLYARDPDFDVAPGPAVRPPSVDSLRDAVEDKIAADPSIVEAGRQAAVQATLMTGDPGLGLQQGQLAQEQAQEQLVRDEVARMVKQFRRRSREIKNFAETCEIVGTRMWLDASLKRRARPQVRSGLTIGVGVIKASWQERTGVSPESRVAINDLQANIQRLEMLRTKAQGGGVVDRVYGAVRAWVTGEDDEKLAEMRRQLEAVQSKAERVIARGFVVDNVAGEDFQVAEGYTIANHVDAPWNAHRIFLRYDDACAEFGADPHMLKKLEGATRYRPRKPEMIKNETAVFSAPPDTIDNASQADAFIKAGEDPQAGSATGQDGDWVALWEIWDRDSNHVLTAIEGVRCWVKPAWIPAATTRFYPFFLYTTSEVDGQRHPQSLVTRSAKLVNEFNRIGSAEAEHRRRCLPKIAFNEGQIDPTNARKLEGGAAGEMVGISTTTPDIDLNTILWPVQYPAIDAALYDRSRIQAGLERIWGVQEALQGSVQTGQTATQAEIQNQGFQARTGARRDLLEAMLSDLAQYTVEIARVYVTEQDVRLIAGPDAFWPPYEGPQDLARMVNINIRAGSSGKPNTSAERQSWSAMLPLLQSGITQIAQLRGAAPEQVADALEQLLRITAERSGDRIDIDQLVPQAGGAPMLAAPGAVVPGDPSIPPGPQPAMPEAPATVQ